MDAVQAFAVPLVGLPRYFGLYFDTVTEERARLTKETPCSSNIKLLAKLKLCWHYFGTINR